ncbi:MAG: CpaF family protein [Micrococcales bacterium]|nr:CpaF family protein [Micrococcales bacterium]
MGLLDRLVAPADESEGADLVTHYRHRLLQEIDLEELSRLKPAQRRARLERILSTLLTLDGPVLATSDRSQLIQRVVDDSLGLSVLEPLLADESVTEIMVNGPSDIFIERAGKVQRVATTFASEEQLLQTIDRIVSTVNRRVDESSPMVDARLPTGERVNVIIPPLALDGPALTIRRFPKPYRMAELVERQMLDTHTAGLLAACVRAKVTVMISGGTGTGKTTFLNSMSAFVPANERIVTIEDAAELSLQQEHVVRLESRPANVEGKGAITIRDLVRNSLRMRPDRIIVGEVRGGETLDMLQAMSTGHEGSMATVHANTAYDALGRLDTLAAMSEVELPVEIVRDQINSAIDMVVQLNRGVDGSRRVTEVAALVSQRREPYRLEPVMTFEQDSLGSDRKVTGRVVHHPLPQVLRDRLSRAGELAEGQR